MSLTVLTRVENNTAVISAAGEVDVSCASELRDALDSALQQDVEALEIDLAEVPYIDSTGIGVLVGGAHRAAEAGIGYTVTHPQRNVERVLGMLGVKEELGIRA